MGWMSKAIFLRAAILFRSLTLNLPKSTINIRKYSDFNVGYTNVGTESGTSAGMRTAAFAALTQTNAKFTLADLSVTGYDAPVWDEDEQDYVGGCPGTFQVQTLDGSGFTVNKYYWVDNGTVKAGWYASQDGATAIDGGASSVVLNPGESLWTFGKGMTLVTSGSVSTNDIAFVTKSGTQAVGVGNGTPVALTLGQLWVTGYDAPVWDEDEQDYVGGCPGTFQVQTLDGSGFTVNKYYWVDNGTVTAGWYASQDGATAIDGTVSVDPGKGFWVFGKGMTLNMPAPEL